jgi:LmbE family N-acetylglucosaminyl deacetylase
MKESSWEEAFIAIQEGKPLDDFRGREDNMVVISPHPDDDVLGAGGVMIQAAEEGRAVFSVTLTDGRGSPRKDPTLSDEEMAGLRQKESLTALRIVGAKGGVYFRKTSSGLEGEEGKKVAEELRKLLESLRPSEIFLPSPYERHRTHIRCTRLTLGALRSLEGLKPSLLGYSLWGNFFGEKKRVARDITPFVRKKVEAVLAHATQIGYKNYQQGVLGKNNAEAIFWESHEIQKATFVETFLDMTQLLEQKDLSLEDFIRQDVEAFIRTFLGT